MEVAGMGWQRYVALGDSFTEGIGDPGPDGRDRGWADQLAHALAADDLLLRYANLSRSAGVEWPKSSKSRCQRRAS